MLLKDTRTLNFLLLWTSVPEPSSIAVRRASFKFAMSSSSSAAWYTASDEDARIFGEAAGLGASDAVLSMRTSTLAFIKSKKDQEQGSVSSPLFLSSPLLSSRLIRCPVLSDIPGRRVGRDQIPREQRDRIARDQRDREQLAGFVRSVIPSSLRFSFLLACLL